jgi:guanine deaminase
LPSRGDCGASSCSTHRRGCIRDAKSAKKHSEIVAIRRACTVLGSFNLPGCDIYTSCEPCPMCLGAIYWARLRRVYFANTRIDASKIGFDDDFIYREVAQVPELRRIPHFRLMTEDAQVAFKEWAARPEKIRY